MIKLDYYFSVIYCTLTSDEIENLPESNNYSLSYDILCGAKELIAATLNKFNSDNYPIFKITEFILLERKIIFYNNLFFISADIEGSLSDFNKNENISFSVYAKIETGENIYYLVILIFLNHLIFISMIISILLLILCLIKIIILFKSLLIVIY